MQYKFNESVFLDLTSKRSSLSEHVSRINKDRYEALLKVRAKQTEIDNHLAFHNPDRPIPESLKLILEPLKIELEVLTAKYKRLEELHSKESRKLQNISALASRCEARLKELNLLPRNIDAMPAIGDA